MRVVVTIVWVCGVTEWWTGQAGVEGLYSTLKDYICESEDWNGVQYFRVLSNAILLLSSSYLRLVRQDLAPCVFTVKHSINPAEC